MAEPSARLLRLLSLFQARREWPGAELAGRLGVSERTIRRDVDKLRGLGYPVGAIGGVGGGYQLGAGASMPPLLLDDDEAVAVAVGLRTAAGGTVEGIGETSVRALAKLDQVLPSRLRHRVGSLWTVVVPMLKTGPVVAPDTLTAIAATCRDHERLRFDYRAHDGTHSLRDVEPHRMVHSGRRWYLVAWDVDRRDWRSFRIDRLTPRIPTGPRFTPREPPAPDLAHYIWDSVTNGAYRHRVTITIHAPAEAVLAEVPPTTGVVEPVDEASCTLRMGTNQLGDLVPWVAAFGFEFEVREPPELVEHLRAVTERMRRAVHRSERASGT